MQGREWKHEAAALPSKRTQRLMLKKHYTSFGVGIGLPQGWSSAAPTDSVRGGRLLWPFPPMGRDPAPSRAPEEAAAAAAPNGSGSWRSSRRPKTSLPGALVNRSDQNVQAAID